MPPDELPPMCFKFGGLLWEVAPPVTGRHLVDDLLALEWQAEMHWTSPEPVGQTLRDAFDEGSMMFFGHDLKLDDVQVEIQFAGKRPATMMEVLEEQMHDRRRGLPPCTTCPRHDEHRHVTATFKAVARTPLELDLGTGHPIYGWG